MRRIGIVGAGQAGLVLAIGLRQQGYAVTVFAERPADEVRAGRLISNQCLFSPALQRERELGINFWDAEAPPIREVAFAAAGEGTEPAMSWRVGLDRPAQSVDQRVKVADWLAEFERLGGDLRIRRVTPDELDECAREFELLIVAAGRGAQFDALFPRDDERSPYREPQRAIGILYVTGELDVVPGLTFGMSQVGEFFLLPGLSVRGPVHGLGFFGVPGGPMDVWDGVADVGQHYETARKLLRAHYPWQAALLDDARPAGPADLLHGRITPVVRHPVGTLPSGAKVLAMGDTAVTNDPVGGQGANMAARAARAYQEAIVERADRPFDEEFMHDAFARYWRHARHATRFNNDLLAPPADHILATLDTAQRIPEVAHRFAHLFENPADYEGWLGDPEAAMAYLRDVQSGAQSVPGAGTAPVVK
ncbi:styrene monooxygenase/indole monooxygenase family protein [Amycolatopsis sp. SID8362]|uniref:styrene monooxygenase/indole monooxygenase family protein n=1 Tax=Amycolatopsis sp. SID8362 TaxID=2690346 RepID=UPI00136BD137|nr:styrene monooxygenase/indole monooxygenase family protein [Amycolatopsis sp. SID8362]NBH10527.1 oxygenase [Amycolatopsis sp. SID8362]NED47221.1 oxygenase [Amycolatopsis sp. SID8362]